MGIMKKVESGITDRLEFMSKRSNAMQGFLNTVVYKEYQNAQRKRWITENSSEGNGWKAISSEYAAIKRKKWASAPGGGTKLLIASGRLYQSVIGPSNDHRKITTNTSISIFSTVPYADYVNQERDFTNFGPEFKQRIMDKLQAYMFKGAQ